MLAAILTTVLFSLSALSGRRLTRFLSGSLANLLRLMVAAILLGIFTHGWGRGLHALAFVWLFISGCVGFGVGDLALFQAYPRIGSRRTMVMVQCLAAPIAALTEWLWLDTTMTLPELLCGALILLGVGIALMPQRGDSDAAESNHWVAGAWFGLLAAACQAWGAVLSRKAYAVSAAHGLAMAGISDGVAAAYQRLLGGVLISAIFVFYLHCARQGASRRPDWRRAWPMILANGLAGPALGVTCYQWALSSAPTGIVLPIVATTPLVVMPFAHFLEGDRITPRTLLGGVLAVAGVAALTFWR